MNEQKGGAMNEVLSFGAHSAIMEASASASASAPRRRGGPPPAGVIDVEHHRLEDNCHDDREHHAGGAHVGVESKV